MTNKREQPMKIVGFMPHWMNYSTAEDTLPLKGLQRLGGRYLINYSLHLLNSSELIDETVVFSSTPAILDYIEPKLEYTFSKRPRFLDDNDISIEQIIDEFIKKTDADIIVLLHPKSPFLQISTLNECIEAVRSGRHDSAFTAYQFKKFAWFKGAPLNYSLSLPTPNLRDIEPITIEQSSLYVFSRQEFLGRHKRIGSAPFIKLINHFEGHEVNEPEDLEIAELIVNSGMFSEI
jgi:CMP-N-acetylneuraminic acid synthetase